MVQRVALKLINDIVVIVTELLLHALNAIRIDHLLRRVQRLKLRLQIAIEHGRSTSVTVVHGRWLQIIYLLIKPRETIISLLLTFLWLLGFLLFFLFLLLIINTVVELGIIIQHVLSIYLSATILECECALRYHYLLYVVGHIEIV